MNHSIVEKRKKNKSKSDTAIDPTFNVRLFINVGKIFEVTKIVLAAPEVGDIPEEPEVGNENSDSEPWPRHTSVHVLFSILLSFSFLFYIFFFYFHASTIEQEEGKKKINSRNCDSNFFRANHPSFPPFSSRFPLFLLLEKALFSFLSL